MSQMQLMTRRSFWPLFWVAFLTGFNDNLFKQGLIVLLTMKSLELFGLGSDVLTAMSTRSPRFGSVGGFSMLFSMLSLSISTPGTFLLAPMRISSAHSPRASRVPVLGFVGYLVVL